MQTTEAETKTLIHYLLSLNLPEADAEAFQLEQMLDTLRHDNCDRN
jgi:hypothetical protein